MHRVIDCKASPDYRIWLRFDDGLEGSVFLGDLLEAGAFQAWRDAEQFCRVSLDPGLGTVVWEVGIRLDPDILYQDLASSRNIEFISPGSSRGLNNPRWDRRIGVVPLNP